jgi:hypothetical protein
MESWGHKSNLTVAGRGTTYIKSTVCWDVMPCSQVVVYRRFGETYFLYVKNGRMNRESKKQARFCLLSLPSVPENGGGTFFRNVSERLPDCTTPHSNRSLYFHGILCLWHGKVCQGHAKRRSEISWVWHANLLSVLGIISQEVSGKVRVEFHLLIQGWEK